MNKRNMIIIGTALAIVVLLILAFTTKKPVQKTISETTPTPTVTAESTPSPEAETPTPTVSTKPITCASVSTQAKKLANEFMNTHKDKQAENALMIISAPLAVEDQADLDNWLGNNWEDGIRLYKTDTTSYTVTTYSLSSIYSRGQDLDERGTQRCQIPVSENRTSAEGASSTVTRYIDFSLDEIGTVALTAYRNSKDGRKYSGFN